MCGIAGFVAPPGTRADPAVLERMVGSLRHRGPDAVGHHIDGPAALGVARLRVIDLETGERVVMPYAADAEAQSPQHVLGLLDHPELFFRHFARVRNTG